MHAKLVDSDPFENLIEDFAEEPQYIAPTYDFATQDTAGFGLAQDLFDYEAPININAFDEFLNGHQYEDSLYARPLYNLVAEAAPVNSRGNLYTPVLMSDEDVAYLSNDRMDFEVPDAFPNASEQEDAQIWDSRGTTASKFLKVTRIISRIPDLAVAPETTEFLLTATANECPNTSPQDTLGSQSSSDSTDRPHDLTSEQVTRYLRSVRKNPQHQSAVTHFQSEKDAERWRKRGQNQAVLNVQDTTFPRSLAEEREYVQLLKDAFKYMGTGSICTSQEQLFITRPRKEDGEKEIESWCWQLLKEIMLRQSRGRPLDLVKRKSAFLDPVSQTFAERFAAVHNALKLEKRCCIRFSNMAEWHKRLANDPSSELAEIAKNDLINRKKAEDKRAKHTETAALAEALEKEKAKSMPRNRSLDDPESGYTTESPSTSAFSSGKTTPRRAFPFARSKTSAKKTSRQGSGSSLMSTPEESPRQDTAEEEHPSLTSSVRSSRRPRRLSETFSTSPMKKLKLDCGYGDVPRRPIRTKAMYEGDVGSGLMPRTSPLPPEASYQTQVGLSSSPFSTPTPYETSTSAVGRLESDLSPMADSHHTHQHGSQLMSDPLSTIAASSCIQESLPVLEDKLSIDALVSGTCFTEDQRSHAKEMGMQTHEYVNFARAMSNLPEIDWIAMMHRAASKQE
jgi:hypothetical protein